MNLTLKVLRYTQIYPKEIFVNPYEWQQQQQNIINRMKIEQKSKFKWKITDKNASLK